MLRQDFCLETPPVMKDVHEWIQGAHQSSPSSLQALSFCCHLHTLCKEHHKPQQQKLPVGTVPLCSPNSKFCPCLPPFSCWKCSIPNYWWLPSFLQSSVWSCFSVTLGKPRSETLHSFHFSSFSSEWTRSCLTLLVRAVVLIFEEL